MTNRPRSHSKRATDALEDGRRLAEEQAKTFDTSDQIPTLDDNPPAIAGLPTLGQPGGRP